MKKDSILYKVVLLGALCAICGILLATVNGITAPIIANAGLAKEKQNLEIFYPGGNFEVVNDYEDESGLVEGVYLAEGQGTIYKLHVTGYNSNGFTFMVAINNDGTFQGFQVLEQNETNGFGSRAFEDDYVSQIEALSVGDEVPLLSGATLTTTAIKDGIEAAEKLHESLGAK